jgi:hypothetical protein
MTSEFLLKRYHVLFISGCLIYELFSGGKLTRTEDLRNIASIPKVSFHGCTGFFGWFWIYSMNLSYSPLSVPYTIILTWFLWLLKVNNFCFFGCSLCFQITRSSWVLHLLVEWILQNLLTTVVSSVVFTCHADTVVLFCVPFSFINAYVLQYLFVIILLFLVPFRLFALFFLSNDFDCSFQSFSRTSW